jgi:hypothetical protein
VTYTAKDLTFNEEQHLYTLPDGTIPPSVTEILSATGVSTDFNRLSDVNPRLAGQIEARRALGTAVHKDAHALDDDDLVWDRTNNKVKPYLLAWMTCKENLGLTPVARERVLYHPTLRYAGTMDGVFSVRDECLVLVDLKIGSAEDAAAHLQTALYWLAYEQDRPAQMPTRRWAIELDPGRRVPYKLVRYENYDDFNKARAVVTTYYEQPARRFRR